MVDRYFGYKQKNSKEKHWAAQPAAPLSAAHCCRCTCGKVYSWAAPAKAGKRETHTLTARGAAILWHSHQRFPHAAAASCPGRQQIIPLAVSVPEYVISSLCGSFWSRPCSLACSLTRGSQHCPAPILYQT
jgi:hypothetical protein